MNSLSLKDRQLSLLRQVHGNKVVEASEHIQEADAQVSNDRSKVLVISVADCYPVLFHDPVNHVVGAAHAGWRGTVAYIVSETIQAMMKLGASPDNIQVAIGQGICKEKFEVGDEVVEMFKKAGFPASVFFGQRNIDLIEANRFALLQSGIEPQNIWIMNRCTYDEDFFSYRRDKGQTGRMWAVIALD